MIVAATATALTRPSAAIATTKVRAIRGDKRCLWDLLMGLPFTLRWLLPAGAGRRVFDSHTQGATVR